MTVSFLYQNKYRRLEINGIKTELDMVPYDFIVNINKGVTYFYYYPKYTKRFENFIHHFDIILFDPYQHFF